MIEMDEEVAKFKWLISGLLMFFISAFFSIGEFKYMIWGQSAEATVLGTRDGMSSGRRLNQRTYRVIDYQFVGSDGATVAEHDKIEAGYQPPASGTVKIQYLPGVKDSSRLAENVRLSSLLLFFSSLCWLGGAIYKLHVEANTPGIGRRHPRRQR